MSNRDVSHQTSPGSPERQLEKFKVQNHLKKKVEEMEATVYHYQRLHRQERTQGTRIYNQAVALENKLESTQKCIYTQDG